MAGKHHAAHLGPCLRAREVWSGSELHAADRIIPALEEKSKMVGRGWLPMWAKYLPIVHSSVKGRGVVTSCNVLVGNQEYQ